MKEDMTMKKQTILIAALLGALVLLGGCNKTGLTGKGGEITFGSVSNGAQTRAQYGDDFTNPNDNKLYTAINWEVGDIVRIISPEAAVTGDGSNLHWADYTVKSVSEQSDGTSAALVNTNPNGLAWTGKETYSFYSVYPSTTPISLEEATYGQVSADFINAAQTLPATTATKTVGEGEEAITYTVYTPDIKSAVMTAAVAGVKENAEKPQVKLHFKPAWTAVEINLSSLDDDIDVIEVQLVADAESTDYLAGPFTMTAGNLASVAVNTASASKTVTLSAGEGVTVTKTAGATFTMLLLPVNNTAALKLRITSKEGDGTKTSVVTLKKSGQPFVFEAGKKVRINGLKAPGSSWKIFYAPDILDVDQWEELGTTSLIVE